MDGTGNYVSGTRKMNDGSLLDPSLAYNSEPTSGMYLETLSPGETAITFVKKGNKRLRIEDDSVDIEGPITMDHIHTSDITFETKGSLSTPSLQWADTKSGMYYDDSKGVVIKVSDVGGGLVSANTTDFDTGGLKMTCNGLHSLSDALVSGTVFCLGINCTGSLISGSFSAGTNSVSCGILNTTGAISSGTNSVSCGVLTTTGAISSGTNSLTCGSMSSGTHSVSCGILTTSGAISSGTNSLTTGSVVTSGSVPMTMENNSFMQAKNSSGTLELAWQPRTNTNATYLQMGSGGLQLRNSGNVALVTLGTTSDFTNLFGSFVIAAATKTLIMKSVAVSGGAANGMVNTGVVLVLGTATITNTSVTTSTGGIAFPTTNGGVTGSYRVLCGSNTYTVTSTSALDTSTLTVMFFQWN